MRKCIALGYCKLQYLLRFESQWLTARVTPMGGRVIITK